MLVGRSGVALALPRLVNAMFRRGQTEPAMICSRIGNRHVFVSSPLRVRLCICLCLCVVPLLNVGPPHECWMQCAATSLGGTTQLPNILTTQLSKIVNNRKTRGIHRNNQTTERVPEPFLVPPSSSWWYTCTMYTVYACKRNHKHLDIGSTHSWKLFGHHRKVTLTIAWLSSYYYPTLNTEPTLNKHLLIPGVPFLW